MTTAYATVSELKAQSQKQFDTMDTVIEAMILAAAEAINNYCNRPDGFVASDTATVKVYPGSGQAWQRIDECVEITAVAVKDSYTDSSYTSWSADDWVAFSGDPKWPDFNTLPYDAIIIDPATGSYGWFPKSQWPVVQVTARWGYAGTTPDVVKQACITQASRWLKRGQSSWADTIGDGNMGSMNYRKVLDPDVQFMLKMGRLIRPAIG